uniref:SH3 domain-containing protein n=1 Tax=Knipowitschia caucasica TaxID=637954 RepID=A0AAV2JA48_KNICA
MPTGENDKRANTRERFNEVLKKYTEQDPLKKIKGKEPDDIALQTLKRDVGKDTDQDETVLPNTHDSVKEPKKKSKKGKAKQEKQDVDGPLEDPEDKLLLYYQQQIAQEDSTASQQAPLNNHVGKKKKKKLKSAPPDSDVGDTEELAYPLSDVNNEVESKGKKKKKKKKHKHIHDEENDIEAAAEEPQRPVFDESLVLGVYVHRTDPLKTDLLISHPMVKVHVVDETTGQHVKKEDCHRPVSSFYESDSVDHILPIMTQPFDFKKHKSVIPEWHEQIIFNERFGWFVENEEESPKVLLFFEILDFMSMEEAARANVGMDKNERGFRKIAWAFLKLVGTNGVLNVDSKLRLQLFYPPLRAKTQPKTIEVVEWWRKYSKHKYPSTLYVTVKGIKLPEHVDPCMRSMMALQEERGSTTYSELQKEVSERKGVPQAPDDKPHVYRWSRLPGQVCRIPNKTMLCFRGGQMGCFTVTFSNAGTVLAAACADRDAFPVVVYEIPSGRVLAAFNGHLKIVYDLCWSRDDRRLLSASSDGTVREWDIEHLSPNAQKVLPHPSFVYCAQYHPSSQGLVVTGGYDSVVRVWRLNVNDMNGQLLQEFEGHSSFINTIGFDSEGGRMFSADNAGTIIVWKSWVNDRQPCQHWCIEKKIQEADLKGVPINKVQLHPNGRCLLIHAKDSVLRMIDLRMLAVKKYTGATNYKDRIYSTFTPCGTFIFSGSEDGMAYVWNTDTGDQVAVYSELCYPTALHGVSFHPHENMVAFCAFGQNQPIHVYVYDRKVSQLEVHNMKAGSRAASVDPRTLRDTLDSALDPDTPLSSALDLFTQSTRQALRMQTVKQQLDSVLEPHQGSTTALILEQDRKGLSQISRSLTFDSGTRGLKSPVPPPSQLQLSGAALPTVSRGFTPVGQRLRAASLRLPPSSAVGGTTDAAPVEQTVVALYNYKANRSDELSIQRGDVIRVLYKDNDTWWFGLSNGLQGYFLASYAVDQRDYEEASKQETEAADRTTPTRVSAVVSSSGELKFLSEPTFSDTDPELINTKSKRKKKLKKPGLSQRTCSEADVAGPSTHTYTNTHTNTHRTSGRPLPNRPSGRTNGAFEPDP